MLWICINSHYPRNPLCYLVTVLYAVEYIRLAQVWVLDKIMFESNLPERCLHIELEIFNSYFPPNTKQALQSEETQV